MWDRVQHRQEEAEMELKRLDADAWEISVAAALVSRFENLVRATMVLWDADCKAIRRHFAEVETTPLLGGDVYGTLLDAHAQRMAAATTMPELTTEMAAQQGFQALVQQAFADLKAADAAAIGGGAPSSLEQVCATRR